VGRYRCEDVGVWRLRPLAADSRAAEEQKRRGAEADRRVATEEEKEEEEAADRRVTIEGVTYAVRDGGALQRLLADGAAGPVVGRLGSDGGVVLDEGIRTEGARTLHLIIYSRWPLAR